MFNDMVNSLEFIYKLLAAPDWETAKLVIERELIRQLEEEHMNLGIRAVLQGDHEDIQTHKAWLEEQCRVAAQVLKTKTVPKDNQNQPPLETKVVDLGKDFVPPSVGY